MSLTTNLVSYWKLDAASGNAADSVGSNTLTNNGSMSYGTGKINNGATNSDATVAKYLSISHASQSGLEPVNISVSFWVKTGAGTPPSNHFVGHAWTTTHTSPYISYSFGLDDMGSPNDHMSFQLRANSAFQGVTSTTTIQSGTWYHIVGTYDGTAQKLYINGTSENPATPGSGNIQYNDGAFTIGKSDANTAVFMNGTIDEVGIWSRALTAAEVTSLYNGGSGVSYPFSNSYSKTLTETVTDSDTLIKTATRTLAEAVTYTATAIKIAGRALIESITASDVLSKTPGRTLLEGTFKQGPLPGGTFANDATVGTFDWTSPGNAGANDASYTTLTFSGTSHYLKATNFNFAIPTGATINGIVATLTRKASANFKVADFTVRLVKSDGSFSSANRFTSNWWFSETSDDHGSGTDLWGETWAPSDINSSNFGVSFSASSTGAGGDATASINYISITVYYTVGGTTFSDTVLKTGGKVLSDSVTYTDTIVRSISHAFTEAVTYVDTVLKTAGRSLVDSFSSSDTMTFLRTRSGIFTEAVTYVDSLIRSLIRAFSEAPTIADSITSARVLPASFQEATTAIDSLVRTATKVLTEAQSQVDSLVRTVGRTLSDTLTATATFAGSRLRLGNLVETVTSTDTLARVIAFGRILTETVTTSATFRWLRNGSDILWINATKHTATLVNAVKHSATLSTLAKHVSTWLNQDKS